MKSMNVLFVENLRMSDNRVSYNLLNYDKIFLLIDKIDTDVINYLVNEKLNTITTVLINNDNILKQFDLYLIINNFKFIVFNYKYNIYHISCNINLLLSNSFKRNIIICNLVNGYNLYSNFFKYILDNIIIDNTHKYIIDTLDIGSICNTLLQKLNAYNISINSIDSKPGNSIDSNPGNSIDSKPCNSIDSEILDLTIRFIHITKNAGTYIEDLGFKDKYLFGKYNYSIEEYNLTQLTNADYYHLNPNMFYNEVFNLDFSNNKHKNFVIVRNPYTRLISELFCPWVGIIKNNTNPSIDEINVFLNDKLNYIKSNPDMLYYGHYALQYNYVYDSNDIKIVDDILRFEHLDTDLNNINIAYNMNLKLNIKEKVNSSTKICSIEDITKENIELIHELYYKDFIAFNYNMEL